MLDRGFLRFAIKLGAYFAILHLVCLLPSIRDGFVAPWTVLNARWAASLASLTGDTYNVEGTQVRAGGSRVDVKLGCNGVDALALCASAMLAFPAPLKRKALGLLIAVVGVFGLNLLRLANLFFVARHFPQHLELFHVYIWQVLIGGLALVIFLLWGRFLAGGIANPTLPSTR